MKKADHSVYIFLPAAGLHSANGGTWGVPSRAILEEDSPDGYLYHRGVLPPKPGHHALYVQHGQQSAGPTGTIIPALVNGYEQQQRYYIKAVEVKGDDKRKDYVALIIQRTNPQLDEIIARFDSEIAMFNDFKP